MRDHRDVLEVGRRRLAENDATQLLQRVPGTPPPPSPPRPPAPPAAGEPPRAAVYSLPMAPPPWSIVGTATGGYFMRRPVTMGEPIGGWWVTCCRHGCGCGADTSSGVSWPVILGYGPATVMRWGQE